MSLLILNKLDQLRAHTRGDPRLVDATGNTILLDGAPKISKEYGVATPTTYKSYGDLIQGDMVYYLDPTIDTPYPKSVYGSNIFVKYVDSQLTPLSGRLIPQGIVLPDKDIASLDLRREAEFRADIMSRQQTSRNRTKPLILTPILE